MESRSVYFHQEIETHLIHDMDKSIPTEAVCISLLSQGTLTFYDFSNFVLDHELEDYKMNRFSSLLNVIDPMSPPSPFLVLFLHHWPSFLPVVL